MCEHYCINITVNDGKVTDMDIKQGIYDITGFCIDGVTEPYDLNDVLYRIKEYFEDVID